MAEWTRDKALCALRYHTKLVTHLLEKLDLPIVQLQEYRLWCKRRRAVPSSAHSGRGTDGPGNETGTGWHISPWGPLYLAFEFRCPLWHGLMEAVNPPGEDPRHATFACFSFEEASLVSEVEAHVCAALRHLTRACSSGNHVESAPAMHPRQPQTQSEQTSKYSGMSVEKPQAQVVSHGSDSSGAISTALRTDDDDADGSSATGIGVEGSEGGAAIDESTEAARADLCVDDHPPLCDDFRIYFDLLVEATWKVFLRARLANALLRGDLLMSAAWALRFLGIGEPWSLRRLQELVVTILESVIECHTLHKNVFFSHQTDESSPSPSVEFLHAACAAYFNAPIIPRFEARLRRCVQNLGEQGLWGQWSGSAAGSDQATPEIQSASRAALHRGIAVLLGLNSDGAVDSGGPKDFDSSDTLAAVRNADELHTAFRRVMIDAVSPERQARTHACTLDARGIVLSGADVVSQLEGEALWSEEERQTLLAVLGTVPLLPQAMQNRESEAEAHRSSADNYVACFDGVVESPSASELRELSDRSDLAESPNSDGPIALDDVRLDKTWCRCSSYEVTTTTASCGGLR